MTLERLLRGGRPRPGAPETAEPESTGGGDAGRLTAYERPGRGLTPEVMRELESAEGRSLSVLDRKWREPPLRDGTTLREGPHNNACSVTGLARDPYLVEYHGRVTYIFSAMMEGIKEESVAALFNLNSGITQESPDRRGVRRFGRASPNPAQAHPPQPAPAPACPPWPWCSRTLVVRARGGRRVCVAACPPVAVFARWRARGSGRACSRPAPSVGFRRKRGRPRARPGRTAPAGRQVFGTGSTPGRAGAPMPGQTRAPPPRRTARRLRRFSSAGAWTARSGAGRLDYTRGLATTRAGQAEHRTASGARPRLLQGWAGNAPRSPAFPAPIQAVVTSDPARNL